MPPLALLFLKNTKKTGQNAFLWNFLSNCRSLSNAGFFRDVLRFGRLAFLLFLPGGVFRLFMFYCCLMLLLL